MGGSSQNDHVLYLWSDIRIEFGNARNSAKSFSIDWRFSSCITFISTIVSVRGVLFEHPWHWSTSTVVWHLNLSNPSSDNEGEVNRSRICFGITPLKNRNVYHVCRLIDKLIEQPHTYISMIALQLEKKTVSYLFRIGIDTIINFGFDESKNWWQSSCSAQNETNNFYKTRKSGNLETPV